MKIVICDPVSPKGIALLQQRPEFQVVVLPKRLTEAELLPVVADAVALVVRSETKVTRKVIEAAPKLRVVGRAGVGVDNVDIEAATQHGTVVMNTPGGNTVTTAELSFAMLLSLARKVPQAHASMVAGKWDRKLFSGRRTHGQDPRRARHGPHRHGSRQTRHRLRHARHRLRPVSHRGPREGHRRGICRQRG
jgi:D-3-phosphoglycerate dehydrogenase